MTDCPGLILCTPAPTPGPTGLTHHELVVMGQVLGSIIVVWVIVLLILAAIATAFFTR